MMTNAKMTIYNKIFDENIREYTFQRTIINAVFFQENEGSNRLVTGNMEADKATVLIPYNYSATRQYKHYTAFNLESNPKGYFTLQNEDLIVKGVSNIEIEDGNVDELRKYHQVYQITSVDHNDFGSKHMQHWKVGAK